MNFLSLFSGIGGFDLGLERAGFRCVGQVEIDPYCRAVLAKHWPDVKRMEDVRQVKGDEFGPVDLIAGGVPCQPASCAGKRKGHEDERWLWGEWIRLVRAIGPAWFIAENVRGFLSLPAAGGVVRDLEGAGYEVRTLLLGAHHVGAPHRRERIWIVGCLADAELSRCGAWSGVEGDEGDEGGEGRGGRESAGGRERVGLADPESPRREGDEPAGDTRAGRCSDERGASRWPSRPGEPQHEWEAPRLVYAQRDARGSGNGEPERGSQGGVATGGSSGRLSQSGLGHATDGLPRRLAGFARRNGLKALGNAVVPQVAEVIGRAIMEAAR